MASTIVSCLLQLPNELLDHTFAFIDTAPTSERDFDSLPSITHSTSTQQPLKTVSLVSRRLRTIVLDRLFAHVRVDPNSVKDLLQFVNRASLSGKVDSIVVEVLSHKYAGAESMWWCLLLNQIPARRIVIQSQPEVHSAVFGLEVTRDDLWAFKVPSQCVEFNQQDVPQRTKLCDPSTGLFAAKQWQGLRVNEGSSLAAYTSYEYFLKRPPSLLASLEQYLNVSPPLEDLTAYRTMFASSATRIMAAAKMIENLREFSYTAMFPFYNHVDIILRCVGRMKNLRRLYMKLCPESGSSILEDAIQAAGGHIDLNDPWSEVTIGYNLIAHCVFQIGSEGALESFVSGDVGVTGLRDNIVNDLTELLSERWTFDGLDTWTKQFADDHVGAVQSLIQN